MKLPLAIRRGSSLLPLLASLATVLGSVSQLPWYSRPASYWELDQIELDQTELEKKCPIYGTAGPDGELIADGNAEGAIEVKVVQSPCGKAGNRRRRILEAERFIKEVFRGESPVVSEPWIPTEEGKEFGNSYTPDRKWDEGRDMTKEEKTKAHEGHMVLALDFASPLIAAMGAAIKHKAYSNRAARSDARPRGTTARPLF
eukprot:g6041.t1